MTSGRSGSRRKRFLTLVGVQLGLLLALLLAAELFVRCWREGGLVRGVASVFDSGAAPVDPGTKGFFVHDDELGYRLNPEKEDFNSLSFRGPEVGPKADGVFRVLVVGDSVAWDNEGFVARLSADLVERSRGRIELFNASVPGYTSYQERVLLGRLLPRIAPDLVLLEYCLNDNHRFLHRLTADGGWLLTAEARGALLPEGNGPLANLLRWSYLAFEVRKRLLARRQRSGSLHPWESEPDFGPAWRPETWPLVREQVLAMDTAARASGARFLVMAVPYEPQLDRVRANERPALAGERAYVFDPQTRLAATCAEAEIPYLDLAPVFEDALAAAPGERLFRDKVHFTPQGHAVAERVLLDRLVETGLVPLEPHTPLEPLKPTASGGESK